MSDLDQTTAQATPDSAPASEAAAAPVLLQAPAQLALDRALTDLIQWPNAVPTDEVLALMDVEFVLAYASAEPGVWMPWQIRRLTELVRWSTQSLWWQQWTGISPDSQKPVPLHEIPILTRKAMREAIAHTGEPSLPPEHGRIGQTATSGVHAESHASPLKLWLSDLQLRMASAHYRANHYQQGRDSQRAIGTLSDRIPAHPGAECLAANSLAFLGENAIANHAHWARSWAAGDAASHAQFLLKHPPAYLSMRADHLSELLDVFEADAALPRPAIEQVITQGLPVDAGLRQRCRAVLGARIADTYSCEEIGPIAFQCPESSDDDPHFHVAVTNAVVQTVRKDKGKPTRFGYTCDPGELGRVLLTGLHQAASPVIRLDTGDMARLHKACPACGIPLPTLSELVGSEHLRLKPPSGERLPFKRLGAIDWLAMLGQVPQDWRMLQTEAAHVRLELVLADAPAAQARMADLQAGLAQRLHADFEFSVSVVDRIDWPAEAPPHLRHRMETLLREHSHAGSAA